jgi:diadenosine tetraphosphate (Ap4A) HIT family hydrolase/5-methylcytosine-specific restriction endonuclease McrA
MTYEELVDFLEHKMSMSHVYQPLLVRALVDAGGVATIRQLAQVFLTQDESQLLYYEKRIKEMPLKVLRRHEVITSDGQLVSLNTKTLTLQQKAHIRMICEQKLQSFVQKRGIGIWDYRLLDEEPIPDSLRFLVLKAAGGRCQLCGVSVKERPLDVDHIIPRSRGGKTELANLQALCSKCNRSKRNQDDTDFRSWPHPSADPNCVFCGPDLVPKAVEKNGSVFAIEDKYPVTPGHLLVIPIRHTSDWFSMTDGERLDADQLMRVLQARIRAQDNKVVGFNIGCNCGDVAGQTVNHAHIHLVPRRSGDIADPRGGVRGVIPEKRIY